MEAIVAFVLLVFPASTALARTDTAAPHVPARQGDALSEAGSGAVAGGLGVREDAVPARLGPALGVASVGPGLPRERPTSAAGGLRLLSPDGSPEASLPIASLSPVSPESILPGDCMGGPSPGSPCADSQECGAGGTCHFFRFEVYRNEGASGFTSPSNPRTALDDMILGGSVPTPPARISSVEVAYVVTGTGVPAGSALRIEVRVWDNVDPSAPSGAPVPSGLLGGIAFVIPGPLEPGPYVFLGTVPGALAIAPDEPSIGYQLDFRDNASGALAYATPVFYGEGVETGSSADVYWRDANGNGRFDASDARQFGGAPTLANFYAHLGAQGPVAETEPNGSQGTATVTASCFTLAGAIDPVGDADWYRFTIAAPQTILSEIRCASPSDDSTLALRDGSGALIAFNDDAGLANHGSRILRALDAGTYFLEVHEKNDDARILQYQAYVGPPPPQVVNLRFAPNKHAIVWDPVPGGAPYDILFGAIRTLHESGFEASVGGCLGDDLAAPASDDTDTPAPGDGFWYLARSRDACSGGASTYDEGGAQVFPRDPLVPPPPVDCSRP
jgi:hypothetical protein